MKNLLAQRENPIGVPLTGIGNIGIGSNAVQLFADVLSTTIGLLTVIAALYFMFMLITGAIGIIGSGGDKGAYEDARRKITTGAIGLVVVIAAMFIMDLITTLLGINNILDIGEMIQRIRLGAGGSPIGPPGCIISGGSCGVGDVCCNSPAEGCFAGICQ